MIKMSLKRKNEIEKTEKIRWNPFYKIIKISVDELYITHGIRSVFSFSVIDKFNLGIFRESCGFASIFYFYRRNT